MRRLVAVLCCSLAVVIAGCAEELDWREFSWPEGGFTVLLPGKPAKFEREIQLAGHPLKLVMFPVQREGLAFGAAYADLPPGLSVEARAELLIAAREFLARNLQATPEDDRLIAIDGFVGRAFRAAGSADGKPMVLVARVIATDTRFYQVVFVGRKDRADTIEPALFLDSLKLNR